MAAHKHAEVIKAWADGAQIEFRPTSQDLFINVVGDPVWNRNIEYRVKPEQADGAYPKSLMSAEELTCVYLEKREKDEEIDRVWGLRGVADAAIQHALNAFQIVSREKYVEKILRSQERDEQFALHIAVEVLDYMGRHAMRSPTSALVKKFANQFKPG